jgi:acyl carrier protein
MTERSDGKPLTFDEFRHVISQELQVDEEEVVREASFMGDLLADSIQLVNLMLRMEEMGIDMPIEAAWEIETVGDAYDVYRGETPTGTRRALGTSGT